MSTGAPETRLRILKTVVDLLESGSASVPMSAVAEKTGITRQALYLHFPNRAELLIAATHYVDEWLDSKARLAGSRKAKSGAERLDAYIDAWCNYVPEIYGVAKALMAMSNSDKAAANAWKKRMQDMWEGCEAAIKALEEENELALQYSVPEASDLLWALLSIRNWESLRLDRGWTQQAYVASIKNTAVRLFVKSPVSG